MLTLSDYTIGTAHLEDWDEVLCDFPGHTVFHTAPWIRAVCQTNKAKPILGQAFLDGECVAAWPILETRKGLLRIVGSPLPGTATAYMGPLFATGADIDTALAAFMNDPRYARCAFFGCKALNVDEFIDLEPYGFERVLDFDTYTIDLTHSEDELWSNLKSECRTQIRKGRRLEMPVQEEIDDSFIDEYWAMTMETFAITNIQPTFTREFLQAMWSQLHPIGQVRALSTRHEGKRVATLILPSDCHTMYYWAGAQYSHSRSLPSHNLLHWHAVQMAKRLGLKRYDFISTAGNAGRFKRTFGPEQLTSSIHWERTSSRLMRVLKEQYEKYRMRRQMLHVIGMMACAAEMLPGPFFVS